MQLEHPEPGEDKRSDDDRRGAPGRPAANTLRLEPGGATREAGGMFAVIFFVEPRPECWDDYLAQAAGLRPQLEQVDGFLDNRRFTSRRHPGRLLSLSFWRDENAIVEWRGNTNHQAAQKLGRAAIFRDYRLYVGEVMPDADRAAPPPMGKGTMVSLIDDPSIEPPPDVQDWDILDGITVPGATLMVLFWPDGSRLTDRSTRVDPRRRDVRIIRRYGLTDRHEAPQYHDPVGPDR